MTERIALRPREVARLLGCRPELVRELCRSGELPAVELTPGRFIVHRDVLEDWLRAGGGNGAGRAPTQDAAPRRTVATSAGPA